MSISERVILLRQLEVISEKNYNNLNSIINIVENLFNIQLSNENGEMFITHISAVFRRVENDERINDLDVSLLEEINNNEYYDKSEMILENIKETINYEISKREEPFIILHLCTLLGIQK